MSEEAIPDSVTLQLHSKTFEPPGHLEFCKTHVRECNVRSRDTTPLRLTQKIWDNIVAVNDAVNKSVKGMSDMDLYGRVEKWAYPVGGSGDCEDFALQKRKVLLKHGLPHSSLLLTVVKQVDGTKHALLMVRTDRGDYFLDILAPHPYPVSKSDYNIIEVQNPAHSGEWLFVGKTFMPAPSSLAKTKGADVSTIGPQ